MRRSLLETALDPAPTDVGLLPGSPDLRRLSNPKNGSWLEFRKTLRPNYFSAWFELFLCIVFLIAGFAAHLYLTHWYGNTFPSCERLSYLPYFAWTVVP